MVRIPSSLSPGVGSTTATGDGAAKSTIVLVIQTMHGPIYPSASCPASPQNQNSVLAQFWYSCAGICRSSPFSSRQSPRAYAGSVTETRRLPTCFLTPSPDLMSWPAIGGVRHASSPGPAATRGGLSCPCQAGIHHIRCRRGPMTRDLTRRTAQRQGGRGHAFCRFLEAWRMISTTVEGRHRPLHEPTEARAAHPVPYSPSVSSSPKCGGGSGTWLASVREDVKNFEGAVHDARRAPRTAHRTPVDFPAETEAVRHAVEPPGLHRCMYSGSTPRARAPIGTLSCAPGA
ncbi:hypothetical protein FKP32DRAFT_300172 [Trametes sanguinea]|nr:hypothetical protein FKP32DRAFT_300172 [Trametes sanguinea]